MKYFPYVIIGGKEIPLEVDRGYEYDFDECRRIIEKAIEEHKNIYPQFTYIIKEIDGENSSIVVTYY